MDTSRLGLGAPHRVELYSEHWRSKQKRREAGKGRLAKGEPWDYWPEAPTNRYAYVGSMQ